MDLNVKPRLEIPSVTKETVCFFRRLNLCELKADLMNRIYLQGLNLVLTSSGIQWRSLFSTLMCGC